MANAFAFDDDDEKPKKKKRPPVEDDEEEERPKPKAKPMAKPVKRVVEEEEDDDDEEERPKPKANPVPLAKKPVKRVVEDEDDEDERPKPKKKLVKQVEEDEDEGEDEENDDEPVRRLYKNKKKKPGGNPFGMILRFMSPAGFLFALLFFFLPWTDINCTVKEGGKSQNYQFFTQSGFQSAYGSTSEGSGFTKMKEEMGGGVTTKPTPGSPKSGESEKADKAYLLWVYMLVLLVGVGLPVAIAKTRMRGILVAGLAGLGFAIVGLQAVIGFPLSNAVAEQKKEATGPAKPGVIKMTGGDGELKSSFLISFYLTLLILIGTGALGGVQILLGGGEGGKPSKKPMKKPKKKPKRRDDYDDED